MFDGRNVVYKYDGSFEGFLCCVFTSFENNELPEDIIGPDKRQATLFDTKEIVTEVAKAKRVLRAIPKRINDAALRFLKMAFLTCLPQKEWHMLLFLRKGFAVGQRIMRLLSDDTVNTLFNAVKHLRNEAHLLTGFIRFSVSGPVLTAQVTPKNFVLPLIARHFKERYPNEKFLIYDKTHLVALIYDGSKAAIMPLKNYSAPGPDEEEREYRRLWKMFYDTIAVPGRENPRCRMSHMPKRYWQDMTEFMDIDDDRKKNDIVILEAYRRERNRRITY